MADIWLDEAGWKDGDLPDLCLECGAPTPDRVRKTFVYTPRWVYAMLFVHLLLMVLLMYFTRKQFRSRVPMCPRHKRHWRKRDLWIFFALVGATLLAGLGVALLIWIDDEKLVPLYGVVIFSCLVGWVVAFALIHAGTIRLTEFSKHAIRLTKVSPGFADACEAGHGRDGRWRGRVKAGLDPDALRRWGETREDRASIRKDDVPRTSDEFRAE
jgi:hypothetical protein